MEASRTIPKVTLYASTILLSTEWASKRVEFIRHAPWYHCLELVIESYGVMPVYALNVRPLAFLNKFHHASAIRTQRTFRHFCLWILVHIFASGAEPFPCGQSFEYLWAIAGLVCCSEAHIADNDFVIFAIVIPQTDIAFDVVLNHVVFGFEFIYIAVGMV